MIDHNFSSWVVPSRWKFYGELVQAILSMPNIYGYELSLAMMETIDDIEPNQEYMLDPDRYDPDFLWYKATNRLKIGGAAERLIGNFAVYSNRLTELKLSVIKTND